LSGAPGCVTWELILDGYSESSYSATPRFAAARLPWFSTTFISIFLLRSTKSSSEPSFLQQKAV
ncbi:hypothetical protein, partial [Escherichia coli]|uniref:hypothetical protein n=1 Tax=Escherichia coli TaxID=562 RepID=UPI00244CAACD